MDTLDFFRAVLPTRGWYYVAVASPGSKKGFKHHPCETVEELAAKCVDFDRQDATVYFATSSYREKSVSRVKNGKKYFVQRVKENVQYVRAFWMDLDVGEGEGKYPSQADAVASLGKFVREAELPKPLIVSSGYGVHAYWPLTEDTLPSQWKTTADNLKALATGMGMLFDPARTGDQASVLRPPGTHNRKTKTVDGVLTPTAVKVQAFNAVDPADWHTFDRTIGHAMKARNLVPKKQTAAEVNKKINEGASVASKFAPASAHVIADNCNQMNDIRQKLGNVAEPLWYAGIQLLDKTIEGEDIIHEWSKGYSGYTKEETDNKVIQIKEFGPTTCATFAARNPKGCEGCIFQGHVSSPIQVGVNLEDAKPPTIRVETEQGELEVEIPNPPLPFKRGDGEQEGLYVLLDGVPIRFYPYDLYPSALEFDEADEFEKVKIHHRLPLEGWKEFSIRSSLVHSPKDFNVAMADKSVKYSSDGKYKDTMRKYMAGYLQTLQEKTRIKPYYRQLGWKDDFSKFMLGERMFCEDGTALRAGVSHKSLEVARWFGVKGDFDEWFKHSSILQDPKLAHVAFTLMIAFGAPILSMANLNGLMFNMLGTTGRGKTVAAKWMSSVYANPSKSMSTEESTYLARLAKFGVYCNLPVYIDELTLIEPDVLSKLAYAVANGSGRERLKSDASMEEKMEWSTFILSSSNNSLHDKLTLEAANPEAQSQRIFEYRYPNISESFKDYIVDELRFVFDRNYGHAGEKYIAYLVQQDPKQISKAIDQTRQYIAEQCDGTHEERFWLYSAACVVYGGVMAKHLGLIDFDPISVVPWIASQIRLMRSGMRAGFSSDLDLLSKFLDDNISERLVVDMKPVANSLVPTVEHHPAQHSALTQRYDKDTGQLYIAVQAIKNWLIKRGEDYAGTAAKLRERKILVSTSKKVVLGAKTQYSSYSRSSCWHLNMRADEAGEIDLTKAE